MTNLSGTNLNNREAVGPKGEGRDSQSNFPAYPEYKDSGIEWMGKVPQHWGVLSLKWLIQLVTNKAISLDFQVALENIEGWTGRFVDTEAQFTGEGVAFREKDILFGKLRPYLAKSWLSNRSGAAVGDFFVLRSHSINADFLQKYILTPTVIDVLNSTTIGAKMPRVGWEDMAALPTPLPAGAEQTQIARFLDHETARIDALIEEQQRLIELLKEKRQAVISHAVTKGLDPNVPMKDSGVEWLGEVPEHWEVTKLGWTISELTYGFTNPMPTEDAGPAMLTANDIGWGRIHYEKARCTSEDAYVHFLTNKSRPKKGDLLLTKDGTLGRVAVHDGTPACINQSVALIRPLLKRLLPDFLCGVLQASCYQEKMLFDAGGTTIKHIYISTLAKMNLAVPPLGEQEELISFIQRESERFDLLVSTAVDGIGLLKERRSALISAAVTGKVDVRNWQPAQPNATDSDDYAMVAEPAAEYN